MGRAAIDQRPRAVAITSAWFDKNGQMPHGHLIRLLHLRLYLRDTLVKLYARISTLNHYPQNLLAHNMTESYMALINKRHTIRGAADQREFG